MESTAWVLGTLWSYWFEGPSISFRLWKPRSVRQSLKVPASCFWVKHSSGKICSLSLRADSASSESSDSLKSYHWVNPRFCQSCFIGGLLKISWQWCNPTNTDNSAKAVVKLWNSAVRKTLPACCTDPPGVLWDYLILSLFYKRKFYTTDCGQDV